MGGPKEAETHIAVRLATVETRTGCIGIYRGLLSDITEIFLVEMAFGWVEVGAGTEGGIPSGGTALCNFRGS